MWVVASHGAGLSLGTRVTLSQEAKTLGNKAVDRAPNGTVMMLEKIHIDYLNKYERNVVREWKDYAGRLTPIDPTAPPPLPSPAASSGEAQLASQL
eukprot:13885550-Heterocapsa_arctica.AAC.1